MSNDRGSTSLADTTRQLAPRPTEDQPIARGSRIGAYVVERVIGAGGGGAVYLAKHATLGTPAAVKVLRREMADSPRMVQRFVREVQTLRMVSHPNVVELFELGALPDGRPYFAMEYLEGIDLRRHLSSCGRMSVAEAVDVLKPVCAALDAAHAVGVVHRDLKASNVHLATGPTGRRVKLLDFGIAKLLEPEPGTPGLTVAGSRLGTPNTMAPEQIRGDAVSPATDVYALGVLLHQLLTGSYPFVSDDPREIELMHLERPAPAPSQLAPVPGAVDAVVLRAMEKAPERRFPSATAFRAALEKAAAGAPAVSMGELARAVAVFLEMRPADATRELDDDEMDRVLDCLDSAERTLADAGFRMALQTSSAVLGVRVLTGDEEKAHAQAQALAEELRRELGARLDPSARVVPRVMVHLDDAQIQRGDAGLEVTGGPITSIDTWRSDAGADVPPGAPRRAAG